MRVWSVLPGWQRTGCAAACLADAGWPDLPLQLIGFKQRILVLRRGTSASKTCGHRDRWAWWGSTGTYDLEELGVPILDVSPVLAEQDGSRWVEAGTEQLSANQVTKGGVVGTDSLCSMQSLQFDLKPRSQDVVSI